MSTKAMTISAAVLVFLLALGLTLYPLISNQYNQQHQSQIHTAYQEQVEQMEDADILIARTMAAAYNEALKPGVQDRDAQKQADLNSTDDFKESGFRLRDYGRKDEVFAVLTIPKINLDMPVYLGATDLNLASGAAHLSQTSLPIGGENTNCVIAGHRGWNGALYFRYVPDLVKGDIVTLRNIWETLTYQVVETKIIAPNDVDAIRIQEGRELLTLLTCHPYASGGKQRFLVICERVFQEDNYGETHGG